MRFLYIFLIVANLHAEGISWKEVNEELAQKKEKLKESYQKATTLFECEANENEYKSLLDEVKFLRKDISQLEESTRKRSAESQTDEEYATWDLGEVTVAEFILEFGSFDYVYVIPSELGGLKMHLYSALTVPRQSWNEMVDLILQANGIGVHQLNPYTKSLYFLKQSPSRVEAICSKKEHLTSFAPDSRIFYLFDEGKENVRSVQNFFERFSDPKETLIYGVGRFIVLVGQKEEIRKLLDMHAAIWKEGKSSRNVRFIELKKLSVSDAQTILQAYFPTNEKTRLPHKSDIDLQVMPLPQGVVLVGDESMIERGVSLLEELEGQLSSPEEKIVYWYTCKHSAPETLAETLEKVYVSLTKKETTGEKGTNKAEHFIVDNKTGSLCMVIRKEEKEKISSLLEKLDIPKKMVQIDVLLVEKKYQERGQSGINLLQLGASSGSGKSIHFDANPNAFRKGVLDFIFSKSKGSKYFPSFDITYSFLMAQENVKINANPSILAINQTPATISIVEEISINNGAVQLDSGSKLAVEKSYTRAQYGTTLVLTPTIHLPHPETGEQQGFITLQTNITFDTTQTVRDDRPPVTKRHIENEVRIADGETIILGGLKRTSSEESSEKIPFLGELPGIGKLFSTTQHADTNTEMFIFITPHIIKDPVEDLHKLRVDELQKRPGDIPSFLERLNQAKAEEKKKIFEKSLKLLFEPNGYHAHS